MPTYTYSYPSDFDDGLDIAQLHTEINASAVGDDCDYINWTGSVVDVVFTPTLSGGQETILDAVIAAHVPTPTQDTSLVDVDDILVDDVTLDVLADDITGNVMVNQ